MKKRFTLLALFALTLAGCGGNIAEPTFTISWKDDDGKILEVDENVKKGTLPRFDGAMPEKAGDAQYSYVFKGWTPEVVSVTSDAEYVATYEKTVNKYTITWKDYDGTTLKTESLEYGSTPEYGSVPTREDDETYSYVFSSWFPAITTVSGNATYTANYTQTELTEDLGVKTIQEVRELCNQLTGLNEAGIAVDMTRKVTIKGLALAKQDTVLTTKNYGYNLSAPNKVIFGDATGYIGCASGTGTNTLWDKVAGYAGKDTSSYEVTGYLSMYLGQPELYVPGKTYVYNPDLNIKFDAKLHSKGATTVAQFYDASTEIMYNAKGHGYGDIYTVKNVRIFDKRDNTYYGFDGEKAIKIVGNKPTLHDGYTYDLVGFISMQSWRPTLFLYNSENAAETEENFDKNTAISTTIDKFRSNKASQEASTYKYTDFIKSWGNLYKANVYASYCVENGKYYVTVRDTFYSGKYEISGKGNAMTTYKMVCVVNDNYWNLDWSEIERGFCPIGDMINREISFDFYFMGFAQEWYKSTATWRVFALNSLLALPEIAE